MTTITEMMNSLERDTFTQESFGRRAPSYTVLMRSAIKNRSATFACHPIKLKNTIKQFVSCCIMMPDGKTYFNIQAVDEKKYIFEQNWKFDDINIFKLFIKEIRKLEYRSQRISQGDNRNIRMIYYAPVIQIRQVLRIVETPRYSLTNLPPGQ